MTAQANEPRRMAARDRLSLPDGATEGADGTIALPLVGCAPSDECHGAGSADHVVLRRLNGVDMEDTRKNFTEKRVDIRKVLFDAAKNGRSPLNAGLAVIQKLQVEAVAKARARTPEEIANVKGNIIKDLFGDKEARAGADIQLKNVSDLIRILTVAKGVQVEAMDLDFAERARDDEFALDTLKERFEQTGRRIGKEFSPAVRGTNGVLDQLAEKVERLDEKYPELTGKVVLATGGMIALAAALAAVGLAAPAVGAGIALLASPVTLALGLLAGGAYYVWSEWATFGPAFTKIWDGTKQTLRGFGTWVSGAWMSDHATMVRGLGDIWEGGKTLLGGVMDGLKKVFGDLIAVLDGWTGGAITDTFKSIEAAIGAGIDKIEEFIAALQSIPNGMFSGDGASRATPNVPPEYAPPGSVPGMPGSGGILEMPWHRMSAPSGMGTGMGGTTTVYIRAEPGTVVTRTEGDQRGIQLNPGPTTVRV